MTISRSSPSEGGAESEEHPAERGGENDKRADVILLDSIGELAQLYQPPYGDRAVALKSTGEMIGMVGFVPCLAAYGQLPELRLGNTPSHQAQAEVGLFWAIAPEHQRKGYALEAAQAMIAYA